MKDISTLREEVKEQMASDLEDVFKDNLRYHLKAIANANNDIANARIAISKLEDQYYLDQNFQPQ